MGRRISVLIADELYEPLVEKARLAGRPPEEFASELLDDALRGPRAARPTGRAAPEEPSAAGDEDPLLALAGCIDLEIEDLADRHDEYVAATASNGGSRVGRG